MKKFYITTAIPYVNAAPHIGHALEFIQADTIARIHRMNGDDVCLLSGGDENALKNVQAAEAANIPLQQFIDANTQLFLDLSKALDVEFTVFQKGSDTNHHFQASQKLWALCKKRGDIYKKSYKGLYCLGCEAFYTRDELNENGECYEHPGKKLEEISEENYFFRLSSYQQQIKSLIESDTITIIPVSRKKEVLSFLTQPLQDISISRTNKRAKNWGVPVPGDDTQRMYVWFDALNIYQSGVGFGWDDALYKKWWPADMHVIGKGITRFHAVYWPAFLLSAGLPLPSSIFVHGYFTVNGQKMSKTLGNVIDPFALIKKYGVDPLRYYFLREIPPFSDGDFSERRFIELYNADLANGLGNLTSRVAKLAEGLEFPTEKPVTLDMVDATIRQSINSYQFNDALTAIWDIIKKDDVTINEQTPWKLRGKEREAVLTPIIHDIRIISALLFPFMPSTSQKISSAFIGPNIHSTIPFFPRISTTP